MAKQLGIIVDLDRCIGCYACVVACKQENNLPPYGDGVPFVAGPQWIKVLTIGPSGDYPKLIMAFIPRLCMHCAQAPCIDACPARAIYRRDDGVVLIDQEVCLQANCSQECIPPCPYNAISPKSDIGVAGKCDLCVRRIDRGLMPACVLSCPTDALMFGNTLEIEGKKGKKVQYRIPTLSDINYEPSIQYIKGS